jgi:large subunit ribosomal protein L25
MNQHVLISQLKKESGTSCARVLRKKERIPAVIYGFKQNHMISVMYKEFFQEYRKGNLLSRFLQVELNEKVFKVITRQIQIHPVTDKPIHVDFQLIKDTIPVKIDIRLKVTGAENSPGIKKGGILNMVKKRITIIGLPKNIPEYLQVDISGFEIGKTLKIDNITMPKDITVVSKSNDTLLTIAGRIEQKEDIEEEEVNKDEKKA